MQSELPDAEVSDVWSRWLLDRRDAGDEALRADVERSVDVFRDRVLDAAGLGPRSTFLDIGCGTGLLGLGAIERVGPSLKVIFSDVSEPLLAHVRTLAGVRGVAGQCEFLHASAEDLSRIPDNCIDVAASRSALAYVANKPAAFNEIFRVLRPGDSQRRGGRISIAEPINQDRAIEALALSQYLSLQSNSRPDEKLVLRNRILSAQLPTTPEGIRLDPFTNFTERDLIQILQATGFVNIHLELHIDIRPSNIRTWHSYLHTAPNPLAPTPAEVMEASFTPAERAFYEAAMRPLIESGTMTATEIMAYAVADKPPLP